MDERDFELLAVLSETKNITHAANKLYVTQSALSKRLTAIEQDLGTKIMLRSRQGIHFTPEGEIVLNYIQKVSQNLREMRDTLSSNQNYISGTLRAGVSINFAQFTFPDILAQYRREFPNVNIQIKTNYSRNLFQRLLSGQLDVAIVRGEYDWKEYKILLQRERICLIRCHDDKAKKLSELTFIDRHTDMSFERDISQWMQENHLHPNRQNGIIVDNITTCVEMVSRGIGWAIVPEICIKNFDGVVEPLSFQNGEPFVRSTYIMYTKSAIELPQIQAFIDTARQFSNTI